MRRRFARTTTLVHSLFIPLLVKRGGAYLPRYPQQACWLRSCASQSGSRPPRGPQLSLKTPSVWGQQVLSLVPGPFSTGPGHSSSSFLYCDVTEQLAQQGLPELDQLKEGVAFFYLTRGEGMLGVTDSSGSPERVALKGRAVGVPVVEGQLGEAGSARVLLMREGGGAAGQQAEEGGEEAEGLQVTVTWNGAKYRQGASHHCSDRDTETSAPRKEALDRALRDMGVDLAELLDSDQLSGSGASAVRTYYSFTRPRPGRNHEFSDRDVELSASRAANQIAFFVRAFRAEQSEYIRNRDRALQELREEGVPMHPLVLVLDNVRSAFNVGSIFRTAETARVEEILTCGFTPHPPHAKLEKTAFSSVLTVPNRHFNATIDAVRSLKERGYEVWAMETTSRSEVYTAVRFPPTGVALVLGNEVIGVDAEVLELCDRIVEIPTFGKKNSLNVASACPVVVFEALRQWRAFPSIPPVDE